MDRVRTNIPTLGLQPIQDWLTERCGSPANLDSVYTEFDLANHCVLRVGRRLFNDQQGVPSQPTSLMYSGICDVLRSLRVYLSGVTPDRVDRFSLIAKKVRAEGDRPIPTTTPRPSPQLASHQNRDLLQPVIPHASESGYDGVTNSVSSYPPPPNSTAKAVLTDSVKAMHINASPEPGDLPLDLPLIVVEYKKPGDASLLIKGTNQIRMYFTACLKFLQAVGITGFTVYGVLTDGPRAALLAAVMDENGVSSML